MVFRVAHCTIEKKRFFQNNFFRPSSRDLSASAVRKIISLDFKKFYEWKNDIICPSSPINLCRKIFPGQLTSSEVDVIKDYMTKPELINWSKCSVYNKMMREKAAFMSVLKVLKDLSLIKYANLLVFKESSRLIK